MHETIYKFLYMSIAFNKLVHFIPNDKFLVPKQRFLYILL